VKIALYVLAVTTAAAYLAYVMRAHRQGRLNFRGRPAEPNTEGLEALGGMAGGCAGIIGAVIAALVGLFVLIWLIKRMWELA
jgi:hypothetical protein